MSLQDVKVLLNLQSFDKDEQLDLIIRMIERQLLSRLETENVPVELDYIVTEVAIVRFNRLGSEGMVSESVEGRSTTYGKSDFDAYESQIQAHLNKSQTPARGVVRFV